LATIPIHRGAVFNIIDPPMGKPKLGRSIGSVHLKGAVYPLVLSFICEMEDQSSAVGIRCRAEKMDFDMLFEQRGIADMSEASSENSPNLGVVKAKSTQWSLLASHFEFTELEGRVISFNADSESIHGNDDYASNSRTPPVMPSSDADREIRMEWLLDVDFNYVSNSELVAMIPFIWFVYYLHFIHREFNFT
jgi:hypothetical protein